MDRQDLETLLEQPEEGKRWLKQRGALNVDRAHSNLLRIARSDLSLDLFGDLLHQCEEIFPRLADPDMALNNLDRFFAATRNPLTLGALFQRDRRVLPWLMQIFSTSQYISDQLILEPENFEIIRQTQGRPLARQELIDQLLGEIQVMEKDELVLRTLRRFKHRETMRIAFGDIIMEQPLSTVTTQLSHQADALLEAGVKQAWKRIVDKRGVPKTELGETARFVILALGKHGGRELNYSSDIDLIFLYDQPGETDHPRPIRNHQFFAELGREVVRLLSETTEKGFVYRVDLRLRPNGKRGPIAIGLSDALQYYDVRGRTWERQAMIKARPVAGSLELGETFLEKLTPWIYHRFLSRADISGIKALKHKIEKRTREEGGERRNVKTGHGGIRDIEFTIQFLQLLNGGELPEIRTGNTLEAIARLEKTGCLSHQESELLVESYAFLRKIEHRLQIMFDLQTHLMPDSPAELRKIAIRMGYEDEEETSALDLFEREYREKTDTNRRILNHLLHDAFGEADDHTGSEEVDLIFDPNPTEETIHRVLSRYGFREIGKSYKLLNELSEENIRYLSTRRCRHFLASIITELLPAIAATPDPDATLASLALVSESTGGKGVLWELFSVNPPSLKLFVRLCAYAPYLVEILCRDPGIIDGLMDSLVLNKLPTMEDLDRTLDELTHCAKDIDPILHGFKNDHQLTVGVRDLLGKNDIREITGVLSDIAQCCLKQVMFREYRKLVEKHGRPLLKSKGEEVDVCPVAVLSLGKFGGREMNYHSDLDVVFLYHSDGKTEGGRREGITNQLFYSQLAQNVLKRLNYFGPHGRLYEIDVRLRPMGKGGTLSVSLDRFTRYFTEGTADLWERQTLTRARTVYGDASFRRAIDEQVRRLVFDVPWRPEFAREIRKMRQRMLEASPDDQLKRGRGGMVDVEFLVQMLQLRHGKEHPEIRSSNTLDALALLREAELLEAEDAEILSASYWLLRRLEGCLKLLNSSSTNRLPEDPNELTRLAHLAKFPTGGELLTEVDWARNETRLRFDRLFDLQEESPPR